jgi:DNA ligase 1
LAVWLCETLYCARVAGKQEAAMSRPQGGTPIAELAATLDRLATARAGRSQAAKELGSLLRRTRSPDEARILPYLLQGKLGPPFAAPHLGMDERRIAQAIAQAASRSEDEVWGDYQQGGDLGDTAARVLGTTPATAETSAAAPLSVHEVYDRLCAIAATSAQGAVMRKASAMAELLRALSPVAIPYVVRMAQGKLRLQIGDAALIDGLSVATVGTTALRPAIAHAYSVCSDLGLVAATLRSGGPAALDEIHPTPGRPVRSQLAERSPSARAIVDSLGMVLVEPKYDGVRLQVHKAGDHIWLFTRRLEDITAAFPELVVAARRQIRAREAMLDGETISFDPQTQRLLPFQETARRRRVHGVEQMARGFPVRYYAFDLILLDGEDWMTRPQRARSAQLHALVQEEHSGASGQSGGTIQVTPQLETSDAAVVQRYFTQQVRQGLEGIVAKQPDAAYHAGERHNAWVKLKPEYAEGMVDTFDLAIVGYDRGHGKRAALGIGSVLGAVYDPVQDRYRTVARVGSGLDDAGWRRLRERLDALRVPQRPAQVEAAVTPDVWVEPREVMEVRAGGITRSPQHTAGASVVADDGDDRDTRQRFLGYALRFPRIVRLRDDKRAEDATTEAEFVELARLAGRAPDTREPHRTKQQ